MRVPILLLAILFASILALAGAPLRCAVPGDDGPDPLAVAQAHIARGAPELAVEILEPLSLVRPEDPAVARTLGEALHAAGRTEAALAAHERAARFPENAAAASYDAARVLADLGETMAALRALDRAWQAGFRDLERARRELGAVGEDSRFDHLALRLRQTLDPFAHRVAVLHIFEGRMAGEMFGWAGIDAGDVDGDGVRDAAISAPFARREEGGTPCGRVEVRSGRTGALLLELWGEPEDRFGTALGAAGDIDGDRRDDLIVGAPGDERTMPGRVTVRSGRDGAVLLDLAGTQPGERFGAEARGIGDWDGDGTRDILVGAPGHDGQNGEDAGRVELVSLRDRRVIHALDGERAGDLLGGAATGAARADGHFLAVGAAKGGAERRGRATLYRGIVPEVLAVVEADRTGVALGEMFISLVGDVDADGVPDFSISDWRNTARGRDSGRVVVHSGRDGARLRTWTGHYGEGFGTGDGIAGDVDGDGHDDLLIGAWLSSRGASDGGAVTLVSGATSEVLERWVGRAVGDHIGYDATGLGDVDGDYAPDFLITAASSTIRGTDTGRAMIVQGPLYYLRIAQRDASRILPGER